jgi:hypothetical protein
MATDDHAQYCRMRFAIGIDSLAALAAEPASSKHPSSWMSALLTVSAAAQLLLPYQIGCQCTTKQPR